MLLVLRLGQSVGVEEDCLAALELQALCLVFESRQHAYRQVRQHFYIPHAELRTIEQQRSVMSGIAVQQLAGLQIQYAYKQRDEHILVVLFGYRVVDLRSYPVGELGVSRGAAEQ